MSSDSHLLVGAKGKPEKPRLLSPLVQADGHAGGERSPCFAVARGAGLGFCPWRAERGGADPESMFLHLWPYKPHSPGPLSSLSPPHFKDLQLRRGPRACCIAWCVLTVSALPQSSERCGERPCCSARSPPPPPCP
ncbi:hypothetical protein KIL84_011606 [Mauremys mutica]|uniref:Uncharacterized protein n=1 Tax=Mauremys mutica TaxID=74926 RepID=A0A9D3XCC8_9SAUR|nr:hypothetical protein KIL84_011606 [Mauremys mutica]